MKFVLTGNSEGGLLTSIELRICEAGSASLGDWGGTWAGGFHIQQNPIELAALVRILILRSHGKAGFRNALEIGNAAGGTTRLIREFVPVDNTVIVDDGKHEHFSVWEENKKFIPNVTEIIGNSQLPETVAVVGKLGRKFDLVSIDADHTYEGAKADWMNYRRFFEDGAVVWFHDTVSCAPHVGRLWEEVKDEGHRVLLDTGIYLGIGAIAYNAKG